MDMERVKSMGTIKVIASLGKVTSVIGHGEEEEGTSPYTVYT